MWNSFQNPNKGLFRDPPKTNKRLGNYSTRYGNLEICFVDIKNKHNNEI